MPTEGNAQGVGGGSKIDMNPTKSSNRSLGIEDRVAKGGMQSPGPSMAKDNPNLNSGGNVRQSSGDGLYEPKSRPEGSLPARTSMTLGGDQDSPGSGSFGGRTPNALQGTSTKAIQPLVSEGYGGKGLTATGTLLRGSEVQGSVGKSSQGTRNGSGRKSG